MANDQKPVISVRKLRKVYMMGQEHVVALHNIDLDIPRGEVCCIFGTSGSGKSTLLKLLMRFWDVQKGRVRLSGTDVSSINTGNLREMESFVTQETHLFHDSIKNNLRIAKLDATDDEIVAACKKAAVHEFIMTLPQGYDTPAGEAGKRLSGGEKQRIAIARMMLKNAPIVILDEATAFTDPENEDKLQRSIAALTKGKTLLVIAHRLSTIKNADNIVVLKNGAIEAAGTQEELLASCPLYKDMWLAHIGAQNWAVSAVEKEA